MLYNHLFISLQQHFGLKTFADSIILLTLKLLGLTMTLFYLSQTKYIKDLLQNSRMLSSKPQPTPMISFIRLTQNDITIIDDPNLYRSIVASLQYILLTRFELSYRVNKGCQFLHHPQLHHWKAVKCIL